MNGLALCAGVAGLELGLRLALGERYRTVGYVERDSYAAATLVARMADAALDSAPVWDDLTTFDGKPWRGGVDLISAGFPCQPASMAGKRLGTGDERWLWPDIGRVIRDVRPRWVFLENVPGLLTVSQGQAAEEIFGTLAGGGFDAEWDVFSAQEAGAPHVRERLFILAHTGRTIVRDSGFARPAGSAGSGQEANQQRQRLRSDPQPGSNTVEHTERQRRFQGAAEPEPIRAALSGAESTSALADAASERSGETGRLHAGSPISASACSDDLADAERVGRNGLHERQQSRSLAPNAGDRCEDVFPPGPADMLRWAGVQADLEPAICRVADGLAHRVDRLRVAGNGVVPIMAALAFRTLRARLLR